MNKTKIENMHIADYKSYADKHNWAERISKNFFAPRHWWNCKQSEQGMSPMELAMSGNCIEVENMIRNMEKANLV